METAAVCQVADDSGIPVTCTKLVSDDPTKNEDYTSFEKFVSDNSDFSAMLYLLEMNLNIISV